VAWSIRVATVADARGIADIYGPIVSKTAISFETEVPDEDEIRRRLTNTLPSFPWLVCRKGDHVAGYGYAGPHRVREAYHWSVETSVYIHPEDRRQGVGRALYLTLLSILTMQRYCNAYAGITLPNPASVGIHESVGFEPIGTYPRVGYKLGAWHDVGWWHRALQPSDASPKPTVSFSEIESRPDWEAMLASGIEGIRSRRD
jgi:L-amino acid N-acyltransferase YncA